MAMPRLECMEIVNNNLHDGLLFRFERYPEKPKERLKDQACITIYTMLGYNRKKRPERNRLIDNEILRHWAKVIWMHHVKPPPFEEENTFLRLRVRHIWLK